MDGLDDIVEEFLVESHENLDQLDADLVALEQEPNSRERLSSIFRTIHTIKGTSGFLAFNRLEEVTHVGENMLSRLRDGELELSPGRTSVLLSMVDTVRDLLTSIESSGGEGSVDVSAVVAAISAAMEDQPVAPVAAPAAAAARRRPRRRQGSGREEGPRGQEGPGRQARAGRGEEGPGEGRGRRRQAGRRGRDAGAPRPRRDRTARGVPRRDRRRDRAGRRRRRPTRRDGCGR